MGGILNTELKFQIIVNVFDFDFEMTITFI